MLYSHPISLLHLIVYIIIIYNKHDGRRYHLFHLRKNAGSYPTNGWTLSKKTLLVKTKYIQINISIAMATIAGRVVKQPEISEHH